MGFLKRKGGFSDVIRCDETDYLVWKWHPSGKNQGESKRETAIRTRSILRVKNGEVAVFFYKQKNGEVEDYIIGPHDEMLKTKNFPLLSSIIGLWYEGDTSFQAEIFFINLAKSIQIRFGVPFFDVVDPRYPDFYVPVSVRGTITFKIDDYKAFVKYHQLSHFNLDDLKNKINAAVSRYIKDVVANAPAEHDIPVIAIESKIDLINEKAELYIKDRLSDLFGISVIGIDLSAIEVDKNHESYVELKRVTKDITIIKTETDLHHYQQDLKIKREEDQYAKRMDTRESNIKAYQTEIRGDVGVAGAEAFGKIVEKNAGTMDLTGQNTGFNPITLMAGIAVGSSVGKNVAKTLDQSINQNENNQNIPPSVPIVKYFVAKDGIPTGPFEISTLKSMIENKELSSNCLVWKEGMPEWQKASSQIELSGMFPPKL